MLCLHELVTKEVAAVQHSMNDSQAGQQDHSGIATQAPRGEGEYVEARKKKPAQWYTLLDLDDCPVDGARAVRDENNDNVRS